jgi:hypothetical protein
MMEGLAVNCCVCEGHYVCHQEILACVAKPALHTMCRKCTTDWLETQQKTTCPLCRAEAFGTRNETLEAVVKCDAFTTVCPYPECGATLPVHQMRQHSEADCEHRPTHKVQFDNTCYDGQMNCETVAAMEVSVSRALESRRVFKPLAIRWLPNGGQPHGQGKLTRVVDRPHTDDDRVTYTGAFQNGLPHGRGKYEYVDDDSVDVDSDDDSPLLNFSYTYDGSWANGLPNGSGTSEVIANAETMSVDDACIVNEFGDHVGDAHPYALVTLIYRGQFVNGRRHGKGVLHYKSDSDGRTGQFDGDWCVDVRHGMGAHTASNMKYEGMWENNMRDGRGKHTNSDANARNADRNVLITYAGTWNKNQRDGYGRAKYANGDVYKGGWSVNTQHGYGTILRPSSVKSSEARENERIETKGLWLHGELQTERSERRLIRVLPTPADPDSAKRPRTTESTAAVATATRSDPDSAKRPRTTESTAVSTAAVATVTTLGPIGGTKTAEAELPVA